MGVGVYPARPAVLLVAWCVLCACVGRCRVGGECVVVESPGLLPCYDMTMAHNIYYVKLKIISN